MTTRDASTRLGLVLCSSVEVRQGKAEPKEVVDGKERVNINRGGGNKRQTWRRKSDVMSRGLITVLITNMGALVLKGEQIQSWQRLRLGVAGMVKNCGKSRQRKPRKRKGYEDLVEQKDSAGKRASGAWWWRFLTPVYDEEKAKTFLLCEVCGKRLTASSPCKTAEEHLKIRHKMCEEVEGDKEVMSGLDL